MSSRYKQQSADGIMQYVPGRGTLHAFGTTVPADGTAGYVAGCIFQDVDGAAGSDFFINDGTDTSCDFNALVSSETAMANRVVPVTTTPLSITAAEHNDKTLYITKTNGLAITLPVPVAGMRFRFIIGATIASASTIKSVAGTHIMIGHALMGNDSDNTTVLFQALAASTFDTINLFGTANSTGGIAGQVVTIEAMSSTVWYVEIIGDAAGTEATPFENTVA